MLVNTALMCLALNIYMEARGEPIMGQYAVASVTVNRAGREERRVCHEVFKPSQFSWANGQARKVKGGWEIPTRLMPRDQLAWWKANRIALMTLNGRMPDMTGGATFYHATYVRPSWRLAFDRVRQVGQHIFYRQRGYVIADLQGGKP